MKKIKREVAVEALISDDIDTTSQIDGQEYLYNLLRSGFKGYANYTNKELQAEYNERFWDNPYLKINKVIGRK